MGACAVAKPVPTVGGWSRAARAAWDPAGAGSQGGDSSGGGGACAVGSSLRRPPRSGPARPCSELSNGLSSRRFRKSSTRSGRNAAPTPARARSPEGSRAKPETCASRRALAGAARANGRGMRATAGGVQPTYRFCAASYAMSAPLPGARPSPGVLRNAAIPTPAGSVRSRESSTVMANSRPRHGSKRSYSTPPRARRRTRTTRRPALSSTAVKRSCSEPPAPSGSTVAIRRYCPPPGPRIIGTGPACSSAPGLRRRPSRNHAAVNAPFESATRMTSTMK